MKNKVQKLLLLMSLLLGLLVPTVLASTPSLAAEQTTTQSDKYLKKIKKQGYMTVGLSADYPPYEFHQTINGQDKIVGFDVSIARRIAKDMGVKLKINEMGFDALLGALKTGKVDMIISGMSETPERAKQVTFSKPYLHVKQVVIAKKEDAAKFKTSADYEGVAVGAQKQTTQETLAHNELFGAKVMSLQKTTDLVLNLQNNKIKAIVLEKPVADAYVQQNKDFAITKTSFANSTKPTAVAMPKDAPALTKQVNKSITTINQKGLMTKYKKDANALMFKKSSFFQQYGSYFLKGTLYTVELAIVGVFFGVILGTMLAFMKRSKNWLLKAIAVIYIEFIRGTPLLIQVFIVFFGAQMLGLGLSALISSMIAVSLNSGAYVAEIIRSGINSVKVGQLEAARSLGLTQTASMRYVVLPQAIKNILPALGNEFITVLKDSSVVSVIGVGELMFETGVVQGASFKPFSPLIVASLIYFVLTFSISRLLALAEHKMAASN
ncbi:ABC transporter substrate-binding protein/permease [Loigolactobacillus backii]|uniref:ABC transporter permease n=1 Tax=Loigolactobacillus backii TaxID=375175 RepID=A0A192GZQ4_9LACO|nr:ABC transporter substrate-binding protein/permease [Loigolactobacillus backii]ANK61477.1 ABC transporter permease [Loigolactobacillus backii]ANK69324.1 ABC transporter permease [Loigolactobacillus backii]MDA5388419.1 ABC transporter substrate-binding protein/permease [Loigolactobacillus backii]MDA5390916.1 ABC transporter substrate-binding protein/permease [Loigolactobacillus backii]PIO84227.1 ABC transporter permease [Loigolactobacillus backii]